MEEVIEAGRVAEVLRKMRKFRARHSRCEEVNR